MQKKTSQLASNPFRGHRSTTAEAAQDTQTVTMQDFGGGMGGQKNRGNVPAPTRACFLPPPMPILMVLAGASAARSEPCVVCPVSWTTHRGSSQPLQVHNQFLAAPAAAFARLITRRVPEICLTKSSQMRCTISSASTVPSGKYASAPHR